MNWGCTERGAEVQTRLSAEAACAFINKRGSWGQRERDGKGCGWQKAGMRVPEWQPAQEGRGGWLGGQSNR